MPDRPLVIFDGKCSFCKIWVDYGQRLTGSKFDFAPSQEVGERFPPIPKENFGKSVQLVYADGRVSQGAKAVFEILEDTADYRWTLWLYRHNALFKKACEFGYTTVAAHRNAAYWITRIVFGTRIEPARFELVEWIFIRLLAAIYVCAFVSTGVQVQGLIGANGILPASRFLGAIGPALGASRFWEAPTLFWFNSSDSALLLACGAGALTAVVLMLGFAQRFCLAVLYLLYLSIVMAGQDFFSFQWDALLLETGFLAIFLGSSRMIDWLFRLLLFRLMLLSGAVKLLSGDAAWRSLDALRYHYWTQPLPTPLAWYANLLPDWFQRLSVLFVFSVELGAPFLIFLPRRARILAASLFVLLQTLIFLTGNYTFFNLLATLLCLFLLDDNAFPRTWKPLRRLGVIGWRISAPLLAVLGTLGLLIVVSEVTRRPGLAQIFTAPVAQFEIVNSYGLFAVMTTSRPEIVVQGSDDGATWRDYEFPFKPGDLRRPPRWAAPYQPRLDWQMWFAALSEWRSNPWFGNLMVRLLEGSPQTLGLLRSNPFPDRPPRFVRAIVYQYRFTNWQERSRTGDWWGREIAGLYFPAISLDAVRNR